MNNTYGTSSSGFSTIQNPADEARSDNYYLYRFYTEYATLARVDRNYPNNSYLFVKTGIYSVNSSDNLFEPGQWGSGMTSAIEAVIKNTIVNYESPANFTQNNCGCFLNDL